MKELEEFIIWHFAGAELDENRLELRVGGQPVDIEARPMELLLLLLRQAGKPVTNQEISDAVWPERRGHIGEKVISNNIHKVRTALGDANHSVVQTLPRKGYRLQADVTRRTVHKPAPDFVELEAGQVIRNRPQWQLVRRLAAGGYGEAWLARNVGSGDQHVFKFSFRVQQSSALKREVTISRLLQKALPERTEFVPVIDWDFEHVPYFIESEFSGRNLREWSEAAGGLGRIPLEVRLALITEIADAIGAAHAVGVLHMDLKPENILIDEAEDPPAARICDFGAGRLLDRDALDRLKLTALGMSRTVAADSATGTAAYLAPELFAGGARTERCDVYSLGVLLYQFVVGDLSRPIATGWEAQIEDPALRDDIAQCTQGDPEKRLASAQLLADRLMNLEARRKQLEQERRAREEAEKNVLALQRIRARRPALFAAIALLIAGVSVTSYLYYKQREETTRANNYMEFFLNDVPTAILPPHANGKDTKYLNALVVSLPAAEKRFVDDDYAEYLLLSKLLEAASVLNDPDSELSLLSRYKSLMEKVWGIDSKYVLTAQFSTVDALCRAGRVREASTLLKSLESRAMALLTDPAVHSRWADMQTRIASFEGRSSDAVRWRNEKLAVYQKNRFDTDIFPPDYFYRNQAQLVADLVNDHEYSHAIEVGGRFLPLLKDKLGPHAPYTLMLESSLAEAQARLAPDEGTENSLRAKCVEIVTAIGQSTLDAHDCWNHLAGYLEDSGRWADAAAIRKSAWDQEATEGRCERTSSCIGIRVNYAMDQIQLGQAQVAYDIVESALADVRSNLSPADRTLPMGMYVKALALTALGRAEQARTTCDELQRLIGGYQSDAELWRGRLFLARSRVEEDAGDLRAGQRLASEAEDLLFRSLGGQSAEFKLAKALVERQG